eukprot:223244_1
MNFSSVRPLFPRVKAFNLRELTFCSKGLSSLTEEQSIRAEKRIRDEWSKHTAPPPLPPKSLTSSSVSPLSVDMETTTDFVRRKRLIYRSKQRGLLEVDLLLGKWAADNVPLLSQDEVNEYETLLNCETIDVLNYVTGKDDAPDDVKSDILDTLKVFAKEGGAGPLD